MINGNELVELAREIIGNDKIELETRRDDIEEWDSLVHVMLIAAVAESFGIKVPVDKVAEIKSVKDLMNYGK